MDTVTEDSQGPPSFLADLNTDSNLSFVSNQSAADNADSNSQDGCSTTAQPLAKKRPPRKQKGELDFLGITSNLTPNGGAEGGDAASDVFSAESLFEYQWPQEKGAEHWMLQEHVQEYLGLSSFKRKHPDIFRRFVTVYSVFSDWLTTV